MFVCSYDDSSMFICSYDDSSSYGIKYVYENTTELAPSPNFIRDVIVTKSGELSILLSNHQILYGKVSYIVISMLTVVTTWSCLFSPGTL